jgi:hypothetical protein
MFAWCRGRVPGACEESVFFFEKKNQKTFALWRVLPASPRQPVKSLLLLFFRKEDLPA